MNIFMQQFERKYHMYLVLLRFDFQLIKLNLLYFFKNPDLSYYCNHSSYLRVHRKGDIYLKRNIPQASFMCSQHSFKNFLIQMICRHGKSGSVY